MMQLSARENTSLAGIVTIHRQQIDEILRQSNQNVWRETLVSASLLRSTNTWSKS